MRSRLLFFLLDGSVLLISLLPMRVLHTLSSLFRFVVRNILKYRREVIDRNLRLSFPDANEVQLRQIRNDFYQHFSDILIETLKTRSASVRFLQDRCRVSNLELLQQVEGRDFILVCGHRGNWEWIGVGLDTLVSHTTYTVYKPLSSELFDRLTRNLRERHGAVMVPMARILREMRSKHEKPGMYVFLADQSPPKNEIQHSVIFLNQQTPAYLGPEKLARALDLPVLFFDAFKTGRGRYLSHLEIITLSPKAEPEGFIVEKFHSLLEQGIQKQPHNWLWSHRRWKHAPVANN